ncbi:MAG: PQQ-dependent sugar dehydrogenase, partial [Bdellovibrionales bacterium]|nr:PQQ-dependent sugar dehydrogenase [Bdellovibrionales bacterium]
MTEKKRRVFLLGVLALSAAILCYEEEKPQWLTTPPEDFSRLAVLRTDSHSLIVEPVVTGLRNPSGMAFLPSGEILITEKSGSIRVIKDGELLTTTVTGVPKVYQRGQGG